MSKILLTGFLLFLWGGLYSQTSYDKIFFTEYVVGSGGQKALEIGNNTGSAISLNRLRIKVFFNGSTTAGTPYVLSAEDGVTTTLPSGSVFVLYNSSSATPNITAASLPNTTAANRKGVSNVLVFSGNDAIKLEYDVTGTGSWQTADIFGKIGEDPGDATGWLSGRLQSVGRSLSRKSTVVIGVQQNPSNFSVNLFNEWKANYNYTIPASGVFESLGVYRDESKFLFKNVTTADVEKPGYSNGVFVWNSIGDQSTRVISNALPKAEFSQYGGNKSTSFGPASGFFKTYQNPTTGKWSFIDPDGYEFFSYGINAVKYPNAIRNLPEDLLDMNFNTLGSWSETSKIFNDTYHGNNGLKMPYTTNLDLALNFQFSSNRAKILAENKMYAIFGTDSLLFKEYCNNRVNQIITESTKTDPYLIGYFSDNEIKAFGTKDLDKYLDVNNYTSTTISGGLGASDPTYQCVLDWFKSRHQGNAPSTSNPITTADRLDWNEEFTKVYLRTVRNAIKGRDNNHLFLSSRFTVNGKDEPKIYVEAGKWVDVLTVNYYYTWNPDVNGDINDWAINAGKPVMITEFGARSRENPITPSQDLTFETAVFAVSTQQDRANFLEHYAARVMESKYCIGFHWFKYLDFDLKGTVQDTKYINRGLVDKDYNIYVPLQNSIEKIGRNIYNLRNQQLNEKLNQTIALETIPTKDITDPDFTLTAPTTSDLNVTFTSSDPNVATISNSNQVHIVGPGKAIITATQAGNASFNPATATVELVVRSPQTITFNVASEKFLLDADFKATSTSGLPVSYTYSPSGIAETLNGFIHLIGPGTVTVTATQVDPNGVYYDATPVSRTFTVTDVIKLSPIDDAYVKDGTDAGTNFNTGTTSNTLSIKNDTNPGYYRESYLKFDLSTLTGGTATSAQLKMVVKASSSTNTTIRAFQIANDGSWNESTVTYNTKPTYSTSFFTNANAGGAGTQFVMPMTSYINTELATTNQLTSFCLKDDISNHDVVVDFYSKEDATVANRPILEVTVSRSTGTQQSNVVDNNALALNLATGTGEEVLLFPNPASSIVTLSTPESYNHGKVSVYDASGQLKLLSQVADSKCELNISDLPVGMYIIKINGTSGAIVKKLLKR